MLKKMFILNSHNICIAVVKRELHLLLSIMSLLDEICRM